MKCPEWPRSDRNCDSEYKNKILIHPENRELEITINYNLESLLSFELCQLTKYKINFKPRL